MSDNFSNYCKDTFENHIAKFSSTELSPKLHHDFLQRGKVALTVELNNPFISELYKANKKFNISYVEILNTQIQIFQLKRTDRVEERLNNICCRVSQKYRTTHRSGNKRVNLNLGSSKIAIYETELENVLELSIKISKFEANNAELVARCKNLHNELCQEMKIKSRTEKTFILLQDEANVLRQENEDLLKIKKIIEQRSISRNNGKTVDELEKSQRYVKLTSLKSVTEKALWFAESYGLTPKSVSFQSKTGETTKLNQDESDQHIEQDVLRMKEILFLLDKFAIGDQAYHELVVMTNDLPKLYLVKNFRDKLSEKIILERTPGNVPGAFVCFRDELIFAFRNFIQSIPEENTPSKFTVKISGDGTKVSRISNYVVMSFVLVDEDKSMSQLHQTTLAITKCSENYENLQKALHPLFYEINELYKVSNITVDEKTYEVEVLFGGDMKFIQLCLGLSSAIAEYTCPWCKVPKGDRGDLSKEWDYYHQPEHRRTIAEIKEGSMKPKKTFSIKHAPLIEIEPENIILDELLLTMRIFDILLRNIIEDAAEKDDQSTAKEIKSDYLASLVTKINECGVSFNIWKPKTGKGERDWTSLRGNDVKKIIRNLPEKLMFVIHNDTHDRTVKLWKDLVEILSLVNSSVVQTKTPEFVFGLCKTWLTDFLILGDIRKGYHPENVTPYMHAMVYHVPFFVHKYGELRKFSGQAVEKLNDNIKTIYQQKTNKFDCAMDTMKVRKRLEMLSSGMERPKRSYTKKKTDWWEHDIFRERNEKKDLVLRAIENADSKYSIAPVDSAPERELDSLSTDEIKQKLLSLGVTTRLRKREKLLSLLKNTYEH